jgi:NAD(P)-dependent dehydrogenase (short-subunit alcohol dehydrogenase family)
VSTPDSSRPGPLTAGNVAVVTGAASGIGRALAHAFAAQGLHVVLADIDEAKLRQVDAELGERGTQTLPVVCNASVESAIHQLAQQTLDRFGGAHILCNNAGVVGKGDPWRGPTSTWDWVLNINLMGVIHGVRAFLPIMDDQGCGHIVNTASMAGLLAIPGAAPYGVSKAAVVALSESLFIELKANGSPVRVSALCPGFVNTNLLDGQRWDTSLGAEPAAGTGAMQQMMDTVLAQGVIDGISTDVVVDQVLDAIRTERFWILTHEDMRHLPVERMQRAQAQENPA